MPDLEKTVADVRKNQQDRTEPPKFISGDVAPGEVREIQEVQEEPLEQPTDD